MYGAPSAPELLRASDCNRIACSLQVLIKKQEPGSRRPLKSRAGRLKAMLWWKYHTYSRRIAVMMAARSLH